MRKKVLGTFQIVMINVIAVDSIRTLPFSAELGFSLIFFYLLAALFFFIPSGLVSAELGTGWPKTGGIYVWVREAFGKKASLIVIWLNWIYNLAWYPTIMALIAGTFTYFFNPALAENKTYMALMILALFWAATFVNFFGMHLSSLISTLGSLIGTILPMVFITILGFIWIFGPQSENIVFSWETFFPDTRADANLGVMSTVLFGLLGLEMAATHAREMKNPQRDYPRAAFYSILIILSTIIFSSLAIAIIVPRQKLLLATGVLQAFSTFFQDYQIAWMVPIVAVFIILGGFSGVSAWIIGPTKGVMVAAEDGSMPKFLSRKNEAGVPTVLLLLQAVIVSFLCLAFVLMPTVNASFWLLSEITAELALVVYFFLFLTGIRLRYKKPKIARAFQIPGKGHLGMWIVSMAGCLSCLVAIVLGFLPPKKMIDDVWTYEISLILGMGILCLIPWVIQRFTVRKNSRL